MSTENLPAIRKKAEEIDAVVRQAQTEMVESVGGQIVRAVTMAGAVEQIGAMLTPDMVKQVSALQNTTFGFMTDKAKDGQRYPDHIVKDCLIEAMMRGLNILGNEFNILQGRMYVTKNGMTNMVLRFPGLSQYAEEYDPPDLPEPEWKKNKAGENKAVAKQCIVRCRASWKLHGKPDQMEADIPILCYPQTTVDAVLGKANRKLKARVHERLMGMALADFDVDPEDEAPARQETRQRAQVSALAAAVADKTTEAPTKNEEPIEDAVVEKAPTAADQTKAIQPTATLAKDGEVIFPEEEPVAEEAAEPDPVDAMSDEEVIAALEQFCEQSGGDPADAAVKYLSGETNGLKYQPNGGAKWFNEGDTPKRRERRMALARNHLSMILSMGSDRYRESYQ